jgi:hypothetical protein
MAVHVQGPDVGFHPWLAYTSFPASFLEARFPSIAIRDRVMSLDW